MAEEGPGDTCRTRRAGWSARRRGGREPDVLPCGRRRDAPARRPRHQADADEERLDDRLDRLRLLPHRHGEGVEPDGPSAEARVDAAPDGAVQAVEAERIHVVEVERRADGLETRLRAVHEGVVAHPPEQAVRDARGPAAPTGDLRDRLVLDLQVQHAGGALDHLLELVRLVELQVRGEAEAVAERARQHARARRRAHQGERRQLPRDGGRPRALAHHDVDAVVLHREVQHLLGRARHAVDLVDEQDLARHQRGQHGREIARVLDGGAAREPQGAAALLRHDHGERRLAEPGRAGEQDVVGRAVLHGRGREQQLQLAAHLDLADELGERSGAERALEGELGVGLGDGAGRVAVLEPAHRSAA